MLTLSRFVFRHRWWVLVAWLLLAAAGGYADPKATAAHTYDFGLPGQAGYETNQVIAERFGGGGDLAPILLVTGEPPEPLVAAVTRALPDARVASPADEPALRAADGRTGVVVVFPRPVPGPEPYARALPVLERVAEAEGAAVTGKDALAGEGGRGADVLAETIFGGAGALIVLLLVFGSVLALMPLLIAAGSILTTS